MSKPWIFKVDVEGISSQFDELKDQVQSAIRDGVRTLATATQAKAHELAAEQLKTTSKKFREALTFSNPEEGIYVISLNEKMLWREDGVTAGEKIDELLKNNAKISKDGNRYKVIPFRHEGGPTQNSPKTMALLSIMKSYLKQQGINYKKLETGKDGKPLIGKLHSFNYKTPTSEFASPKPSKMASFPTFAGLNIYQHKNEKGAVQRSLVTFRVVSDKQKGSGKWVHPGLQGAHILDQAFFAMEQLWETDILPAILDRFK